MNLLCLPVFLAALFTSGLSKYTYNDESGDQLIYVVDFVRHGSRAPKYQNKLNSTKVYYNDGLGEITPMGMRMLYLRGLENRRRYIDQRQLLNGTYQSEEIEIFSSEEGRVQRSAMSYFMGLYPPNKSENQMTDEEIMAAMPPFQYEEINEEKDKLGKSTLENNYQIVPIQTNAFKKPDMLMGAFEGSTCPFFNEGVEYLLKHNLLVNKTMAGHEKNAQKWIVERLNLNRSIDEQWAKRIIDEMITNHFEQRYVPYQQLTSDEWIKLYNYLSDYAYVYLFGNDPIVRLLTSELLSFMLNHFEGKAKATLGQTTKTNEYLKRHKYTYLSGRGTEIPMIFQAFRLSEEDRILPKFATSFVFEFWKKRNASADAFERQDYYMRIFLDDKPLKMPDASCDSEARCSWESVAKFMENRIISPLEVEKICFSHLDYSNDSQDGQQWLMALFISLPLSISTALISKYLYNLKCKSNNKKGLKTSKKDYLPLQNQNSEDEEQDSQI